MDNHPAYVEMKNISKSFYGVTVLKDVSIAMGRGQCIGLLGENGAGKSTLIKILCGVYTKDSGDIFIDGKEIVIESVEDAQSLGIRTIYQELSLFPTMTIVENIFINNEICKNAKNSCLAPLEIVSMREEAERIFRDILSVDIDVSKKIEEISFSQKQLVEIARAVYSNGKIVIMDEPTTGLERKEKLKLFQVIKDLKANGTTIIFISHHLDEIMEVCDRTVVLRDGEIVLDDFVAKLNVQDIVKAMIGKSVDNYYPKVEMQIGKVLLSVKNLSSTNNFEDINFDVREKEILGIVGLTGCGKNEILRALFGIVPYERGTIEFKGKRIANKNVNQAMRNHFAFLPAERKTEGIFDIQSVSWNTSIAALDKIKNLFKLNLQKETNITNGYISDLGIKIHSPKQLISHISGGNQQKVMLSRWFLTDPDILLLEEPTRGIDVNAKVDVCRLISNFIENDKCVIMVSSEESEVLGMCDRIIVIHEGNIVAELDAKKTSVEEIKYYSANITNNGGKVR